MAENSEKSYKTIALILGIALVVAIIGWMNAKGSTDAASLRDRLELCDGLTLASENPECEAAINELEGLLLDFQGTLQKIALPAASDSQATSTATTTPQGTSTATTTR